MKASLSSRGAQRRGIAAASRVASLGMTLAALSSGGCSWFKGLVYHPVPVANAVGDSTTTLGGAKVHVYRTERYEVYGPTVVSVSTAVDHLDRAYFQWSRYFGVQGARVALVMFDHPDSLAARESQTLRRRGLLPIAYVRPRDARDYSNPYEEQPREAIWPVGPTVAQELLAAYAAQRRSRELPPRGTAARDTLLDEYPRWFRAAVSGLLADPGAPDRALDLVHDRANAMLPLATLLTRRHFDLGDTTQKSVRELQDVVNAEGVAFVLYASEQEGPRFVGRMADVFLAGGTAAGALHDARQLPHDINDVERLFRKWIDDQR